MTKKKTNGITVRKYLNSDAPDLSALQYGDNYGGIEYSDTNERTISVCIEATLFNEIELNELITSLKNILAILEK